MTLLLCAPTAEELAAMLPDTPASSLPSSQGVAETLRPARLKRGQALVCLTGVGPINAAWSLGCALTEAKTAGTPVSGVLLIGLAGAFDLTRHPLGSLCLAREEIWPEYGLHDGASVTARAFAYPLWRREGGGGEDVYDRLPLAGLEEIGARPAMGSAGLAECRSLTVAGVTASRARAVDLAQRYSADLENMEGFAVAYACARYGIPCVEVRSVSNKVGPRAKHEKDFPGALRRLGQILPTLNLL